MLQDLQILACLTVEEATNLEMFCQERSLEAGEVLFYEDEEANAMYFLKSGAIDIVKGQGESQVVLGQVHAEEILGEMALFNPETLGRRSAGAIASEPCVLITILSFSIQELARQHPELMEKIKAVIEERMYQNKVKQG